MSTATATPRRRERNIDIGHNSEAGPSTELLEIAREAFSVNRQKNALQREETRLKKELHKKMADEGHTEIKFTTMVENEPVRGRADLAPEVKGSIDLYRLREIVGDDVFMQIVKATQTDVKEHVGAHVLNQIYGEKLGDPKLSLKKDA